MACSKVVKDGGGGAGGPLSKKPWRIRSSLGGIGIPQGGCGPCTLKGAWCLTSLLPVTALYFCILLIYIYMLIYTYLSIYIYIFRHIYIYIDRYM